MLQSLLVVPLLGSRPPAPLPGRSPIDCELAVLARRRASRLLLRPITDFRELLILHDEPILVFLLQRTSIGILRPAKAALAGWREELVGHLVVLYPVPSPVIAKNGVY
jgi:hypothetical protein